MDKKVLKIIILSMLALFLVALIPLPYAYYKLMKAICFLLLCFVAYSEFSVEEELDKWIIAFILLAVLYNPFGQIHLNKILWTIINFGTVGILSGFYFLEKNTLLKK